MSECIKHSSGNCANILSFTISQHCILIIRWQVSLFAQSPLWSSLKPHIQCQVIFGTLPGLRLCQGTWMFSHVKRCFKVVAAVRLSARSDMAPRCQRGKALIVQRYSKRCKVYDGKKNYTFPEMLHCSHIFCNSRAASLILCLPGTFGLYLTRKKVKFDLQKIGLLF